MLVATSHQLFYNITAYLVFILFTLRQIVLRHSNTLQYKISDFFIETVFVLPFDIKMVSSMYISFDVKGDKRRLF